MEYKYIGVDLATEKLDVYSEGGYVALKNNEEGRKQFLDLVKQTGPEALVAYESTGYVSKHFAGLLFEHGVKQVCINPTEVCSYAKVKRKKAKNDRLDSMKIYGLAVSEKLQPDPLYDKFVLELRDKVALRKSLVESRKTLKCAPRLQGCQGRAHRQRAGNVRLRDKGAGRGNQEFHHGP